MEYRATPLANGLSPAELLFGRKIRTMVPCTSSSLTPKTVDQSKLRGEEEQRKMAQKTSFDRRHAATKKAELIADEKVWVKVLRAWGSVIEKASAPRSYIVETPVGTYSETSPDHELPAEMEETPGNELPAEELQQQTAIAPEMKPLSPSPGKVTLGIENRDLYRHGRTLGIENRDLGGLSSIQMVRRWRSWFLEGRQNVHDDERSDRSVTATDNAAVAAVRNVVKANRRVTIDEIMIRLPPGIEIGCSSIGTIMSDVLFALVGWLLVT
ncbi:hypothetical protein LAZ67_15002013 [Cordylochernes scorpioides]|uniref:Uncharacterized protein n=1 Tax=Cordylochernes scorpioides TaxID=51811 RepID=A0ABY6LA39_9ARAC|nr:hypothetical protein LAZ67_15002013 [Cordylochernes scorpioides]